MGLRVIHEAICDFCGAESRFVQKPPISSYSTYIPVGWCPFNVKGRTLFACERCNDKRIAIQSSTPGYCPFQHLLSALEMNTNGYQKLGPPSLE